MVTSGGSPAMRLRVRRTCMMFRLEATTSSMDGISGAPSSLAIVGIGTSSIQPESAAQTNASLRIRRVFAIEIAFFFAGTEIVG